MRTYVISEEGQTQTDNFIVQSEVVSEENTEAAEVEEKLGIDDESVNDQDDEVELQSATSGMCGENLTWEVTGDDTIGYTLHISGTGDMEDYGGQNNWRPWSSSIQNVIIDEGATSIGEGAFMLCTELTNITIPQSVNRIGVAAFYLCSKLSSITIPKGVKTIEQSTFFGCGVLNNVILPNGLTTLSSGAFQSCVGLTNISIPNSVTYIERTAFLFCSNLTTVYYNGSDTEWENINILQLGNDSLISAKRCLYTIYQGYTFKNEPDGNTRCYDANGVAVINQFKCDGTYTYYFQADGTAMKDRLTYHPDGVHVIYFDSDGHEVFSDFSHVKKSIAGEAVDDYCFFDVYGYLYVDVLTYDKAGSYMLYANPYGRMECYGEFTFSDTVKWADGTACDVAGKCGYAETSGTLGKIDWIR